MDFPTGRFADITSRESPPERPATRVQRATGGGNATLRWRLRGMPVPGVA